MKKELSISDCNINSMPSSAGIEQISYDEEKSVGGGSQRVIRKEAFEGGKSSKKHKNDKSSKKSKKNYENTSNAPKKIQIEEKEIGHNERKKKKKKLKEDLV